MVAGTAAAEVPVQRLGGAEEASALVAGAEGWACSSPAEVRAAASSVAD